MDFDSNFPLSPCPTASVSSHSSSWDPLPPLYSGRDSVSSVCDFDELQESSSIEDYHFSMSPRQDLAIAIPMEDIDALENRMNLLDNDDQKSFSQFIHMFDQDKSADPSSTYHPYDGQQNNQVATNDDRLMTLKTETDHDNTMSILQSFESVQQDRRDSVSVEDMDRKRRSSSEASRSPSPERKRIKSKELLTEDEKRANHIASEQKRRNTIRTGFKDLTDIVPTLKNVNNSKSTILFKAVDYIRQLEKRNKGLQDRLAKLQSRMEAKGRMEAFRRQSMVMGQDSSPKHGLLSHQAMTALLAHKDQQRQLEMLQKQLHIQQELLKKHNITAPSSVPSFSIPNTQPEVADQPPSSLFSRFQQQQQQQHKQQQQHVTAAHPSYNSISISYHKEPSASAYVNINGINSYHHQNAPALVVPATEEDETHYASDWPRRNSFISINVPSLNIPADEEYSKDMAFRERLLSCGRLTHLQTSL
ncbi:uncharacterized protein BYT42DRAFT_543856 [Radiomyces spectabilis]|uniref:uncharacterized protein n=1 Tax=Radiomyces spectabilis TaxID=64574 RepID=UPI002220F4A3|nr:uncharacterized protein BYT42DRAFT_543856 [Radiomyces spectabilis]KAI8388583.1 hypothetical protein BYT42DRAFT_543856 [Radiomyces spectabilis]